MGRSVVFSAFYADFWFLLQISDYHHLNCKLPNVNISSLIYHLTIKQDVGRESSRNTVIIISLFSEEIHTY